MDGDAERFQCRWRRWNSRIVNLQVEIKMSTAKPEMSQTPGQETGPSVAGFVAMSHPTPPHAAENALPLMLIQTRWLVVTGGFECGS